MFYTIIGTQWGDEGKGKIVDWLSLKADVIVRFQGGNNAGHTIKIKENVYKLNLIPSGIIRNKKCFIGNGVVLDPWALVKEIKQLNNKGIKVDKNNLFIAENVCLILPIHKTIDEINEQPFNYGIYSIQLFIDSLFQYEVKFDKTSFDQAPQSYIERDYELIANQKGEFYRLFKSKYENNYFVNNNSKESSIGLVIIICIESVIIFYNFHLIARLILFQL